MTRHLFAATTFVLGLAATAAAQAPAAPAAGGAPQAPPAAGAAPQGGRGGGAPRGGYAEAATLVARIMNFTAQPASVKPGEAVTLNWAVENPRTVTITPDVGRAAPRGPLKVTPKQTTTYTLTVTGVNPNPPAGVTPVPPQVLTRTITVTVAGTQPRSDTAAVSETEQPVPRTAEGRPDLSGVYGYGAAVGGRGGPPPAPGTLPTTPTLKDESFRVRRGPTDTGLYASCRPPGVPQTFFVPYYMQMIQGPKHVVIIHEYLTLPRIILMDEELPADPDPFYMGHSVGRWDGDTLVVTSAGFKESEINNIRTTEAFRTVERFRRPRHGTLEYEIVMEDPNVFAGPWRINRTFPLMPEHKRVDEFFCENNRDYKPLFGN